MAEVAGARKRTEAPPGGDGRAAGEVSQSLVILGLNMATVILGLNTATMLCLNIATCPKNGVEESVTLIAFLVISCLNTA